MSIPNPGEGVLVSYDVSNDRNRRRAAKLLDGIATRALYSAYLLPPTNDPTVRSLMDVLAGVVGDDDTVSATPFCGSCQVELSGEWREEPMGSEWLL